jgi:hypothetical protein
MLSGLSSVLEGRLRLLPIKQAYKIIVISPITAPQRAVIRLWLCKPMFLVFWRTRCYSKKILTLKRLEYV